MASHALPASDPPPAGVSSLQQLAAARQVVDTIAAMTGVEPGARPSAPIGDSAYAAAPMVRRARVDAVCGDVAVAVRAAAAALMALRGSGRGHIGPAIEQLAADIATAERRIARILNG